MNLNRTAALWDYPYRLVRTCHIRKVEDVNGVIQIQKTQLDNLSQIIEIKLPNIFLISTKMAVVLGPCPYLSLLLV